MLLKHKDSNDYHQADEQIIRKRTNRHARAFNYKPNDRHVLNRKHKVLLALALLIFCYASVRLIIYGTDYILTKQASSEMSKLYHKDAPEDIHADSPHMPESATATPIVTPSPQRAAPASPHPAPTVLNASPYPNNPHLKISSRFTKLRRQNEDIIGWLNIEKVIDQAVVQRDNEYYLRRDYRGYHNSNGAVFLDESCNLKKCPNTLMLYAHNMKTGAMFGVLRNYENIGYYRNNCFAKFDTIYEEVEYVVFAVNTISLKPAKMNYINFTQLCNGDADSRNAMLERLKKQSVHSVGIDADASDQLLLLITCVEDESERRVITARQLRDGETRQELQKIINKSKKRK